MKFPSILQLALTVTLAFCVASELGTCTPNIQKCSEKKFLLAWEMTNIGSISAGNPAALWARVYVDGVLIAQTGVPGNTFEITNVAPSGTAWRTDPNFVGGPNWHTNQFNLPGCPTASNNQPWQASSANSPTNPSVWGTADKPYGVWYPSCTGGANSNWARFVFSVSATTEPHQIKVKTSVDNTFTLYFPATSTSHSFSDWTTLKEYTFVADNSHPAASPPECKCTPDSIGGVWCNHGSPYFYQCAEDVSPPAPSAPGWRQKICSHGTVCDAGIASQNYYADGRSYFDQFCKYPAETGVGEYGNTAIYVSDPKGNTNNENKYLKRRKRSEDEL
ncbi:hypothetical protein HK099_003596 [Clydaea vesicula]|uniref:Uncharacterized protein n=1 Tax=Clydaea vesicula TaxID=447962 RepID=A0AAD5U1G5_9FUNG|nr:hypothetical protein HK099_003596 [Clydaea vesicula]